MTTDNLKRMQRMELSHARIKKFDRMRMRVGYRERQVLCKHIHFHAFHAISISSHFSLSVLNRSFQLSFETH